MLVICRMTSLTIRRLAPLARSVMLGVVVVLLAACSGAAAQSPWVTSTPESSTESSTPALVSTLLGAAAPAPSVPARIVPDGRWPSAPSPIVSRLSAATPRPGSQLAPPARPGPFTIDLFRRGDFVSEARVDWCVPAAIQMMANLIDRHANGSLPSQRVLDRQSRALSSSRLVGRGSEPQGWAGVLNALGDGPYVVVARRTFRDAIATAASALRLTGRPVGLLVWRGAHAWVMSGFEATADPGRSTDFRVTGVRIIDPWYPRRLSAWGRTRAPDTRIGLTALARNFVRWHRPMMRYAELDGRFVLVLPVPAPFKG
jgi:hypothetical protein